MQTHSVSSLTPVDSLLTQKKQQSEPSASFQQILEQVSQKSADQLTASAVDSAPKAAAPANDSAKPETLPIEKLTINGKEVIVSGHGFELPEHVDGVQLEQIVSTPEMREQFEENVKLRGRGGEGIATMIAPDQPIQGSGRLKPISFLDMGLQPGEVYLSTDPNAVARYERQKLTEFIDHMEMVKDIEQRYGKDVKVAFDPQQQSYVMLRPGDNHYDNVLSGKESDEHMKMIFESDPRRFNYLGDILQQYSYTA